jgi:hypothetical protein
MHKVAVVLIIGAALLSLGATPALADVDPIEHPTGVGIGVSASNDPGIGAPARSGKTCSWTVSQAAEPEPFKSIWAKVPPPTGQAPGSGQWARWDCSDSTAGIGWMRTTRPIVVPVVLAREAYRYLPLPAPRLRTNPAVGSAQLVNLRTCLWVDPATWGSRSATASVPGVSATETAVPVSVTWTMGDGGRVVCRGPGIAYDPTRLEASQQPACSYTYRHAADAYAVVATTTWRITWIADGAPGGGTLPPLARTSPARLLRVVEVQAINQ